MAVIDDIKTFLYTEMPNRIVLIQGNIEAIGNPNKSSLNKVKLAPLGTMYLQEDIIPKLLFVRVASNLDGNDWVQVGTSRDIGIEPYNTGLGGVSVGQIVYVTSTNTVCTADCNNIVCSNRVIGLAVNSASQGEIVHVKSEGKIINALWKGIYVTGDLVYCGTSGEITKSPNINTSKFIQKIGVFTNDEGELKLEIAESVELE
jgi:hypothetical protein